MRLAQSLIILLFISLSFSGFSRDIEKILDKADAKYAESPAESFALLETAEKEAESTNNHRFDGDIHYGKARYYLVTANYDASILELNEAILIFEKDKDLHMLSASFSLKSILLERLGEGKKAHNYLLQALKIDRQIGEDSGIRGTLSNLTLDYYHMAMPDSMKICLEELEQYQEEPEGYYYYYQNWGLYFLLIEDYDRSIQQFELAREVSEKQKMTDSKATILMELGRANRLKGNYSKAEEFALESYTFSQTNNLSFETLEALEELILIKEAQNDFKGAFGWLRKWIRVDKEINDLERIQKVKTIESQLEIVQKEKLIAEGEAALQAEKLSGEKARSRNIWLGGIVVIIVLLLAFTVFIYRKTKTLNLEITEQKEIVELKSLKLEDALNSLEDSLEYSKLIQSSMLPTTDILKDYFDDSFVLFKPKDIVSGDFYWFHKDGDALIFAVGDCTGHGVPGAMVSMVCNEALNKVVKEQEVTDPSKILDKVRELVIETFKNKDKDLNDGMDIAICRIEGLNLEFAGAQNPVWLFRNSDLEEQPGQNEKVSDFNMKIVKGDKQPIGKFLNPKPFSSNSIKLIKGDLIYLFSDGFVDQFGGEKGKKFKASNLKNLLATNASTNCESQLLEIENAFNTWMGELEQVDDVCMVGVKV